MQTDEDFPRVQCCINNCFGFAIMGGRCVFCTMNNVPIHDQSAQHELDRVKQLHRDLINDFGRNSHGSITTDPPSKIDRRSITSKANLEKARKARAAKIKTRNDIKQFQEKLEKANEFKTPQPKTIRINLKPQQKLRVKA